GPKGLRARPTPRPRQPRSADGRGAGHRRPPSADDRAARPRRGRGFRRWEDDRAAAPRTRGGRGPASPRGPHRPTRRPARGAPDRRREPPQQCPPRPASTKLQSSSMFSGPRVEASATNAIYRVSSLFRCLILKEAISNSGHPSARSDASEPPAPKGSKGSVYFERLVSLIAES